MLGPAAAVRSDDAVGDPETAGRLTPDHIDRVLADFRDWLGEFAGPNESPPAAAPFDLFSLVGQLAALRHDVSLQTKAARTMTEQTATAVAAVRESSARPSTPMVDVRPLVKALIDVADALATAHVRVSRSILTEDTPLPSVPDELLAVVNSTPTTASVGLFARLLGGRADHRPIRDWLSALTTAEEERAVRRKALADRLAGVADGYGLSLRRVERLLPQFGLEPIPCVGEPFDPETMEAVEMVGGAPPGVVVQEVRRGYRWDGQLFRPAQVTVAR